MTIKDRPYPFPDAHNTVMTCSEQYGYSKPCATALVIASHKAAMTFFIVLLGTAITKVVYHQLG